MKPLTDTNNGATTTKDVSTNRCHPDRALPWHQHPLVQRRPGRGRQIMRWMDCRVEACAPTREAPAQQQEDTMGSSKPRTKWTGHRTGRRRGKRFPDDVVRRALDLWWTTTMTSEEIAREVNMTTAALYRIAGGGYRHVTRPAGWPSHRQRVSTARGKHVVDTGLPLVRKKHERRRTLKREQVEQIIKAWWETSESYQDIAQRLGLRATQVMSVVAGSAYHEVPRPSEWPSHRPPWRAAAAAEARRRRKLDPRSKPTPSGKATRAARHAARASAPAGDKLAKLARKAVDLEVENRKLRARVAELEAAAADTAGIDELLAALG